MQEVLANWVSVAEQSYFDDGTADFAPAGTESAGVPAVIGPVWPALQQLVGVNAPGLPGIASELPGAVCELPAVYGPPLVAYEPLVDAGPRRLAVYVLLLPVSELPHFVAAVFAHPLAGLTVIATVNEIHAIFIGTKE